MTKSSGIGDQLWWSGLDVSGSIGSLGRIGGGPNLGLVTDITQGGNARLGLLLGAGMDMSTWFTPDEDHPTFSALSTGDQLLTYRNGSAIGSPAASLVVKQLDYAATRGADGSLSFTIGTQGNGVALEWGDQATAGVRTDTAATNGASLDGGASSAFGLVAHLHVFAFTGTSVTIKLQESADNGGADPWADAAGGGFTPVTAAPTWQRIATAGTLTVERYLRVVTTGTFSNVQFGVSITRREVAPA